MLNQPYLNPAYLIETLAPDTVFFISERESVCLQDFLYYRLVQLIDGQRQVDEIIDLLQLELLEDQESTQNPANFFQEILNFSIQIQQALFQLHKQGYILEQKELLPANLAVFCHHLNISTAEAYQQLQATKVAVKNWSSVAEADFIEILKSFQIQVAEAGDLTIILTDDYLHPNLEEFNQQALAAQTPWMLLKPLGTIIWIGPLFHPYQTGCWHCFAQRWRDNRPIEEFIGRHKEITNPLTPPLGFAPATVNNALTMAATEVFQWIVHKNNPKLAGNLITYDTLTLQTQNHTLVKTPSMSQLWSNVNSTTFTCGFGTP